MAGFECCRHCVAPKRHPACHGTCEDYKKAKDEDIKKRAFLEPHIADKYTIANGEKCNMVRQLQHRKFKQNCGSGAGHK